MKRHIFKTARACRDPILPKPYGFQNLCRLMFWPSLVQIDLHFCKDLVHKQIPMITIPPLKLH